MVAGILDLCDGFQMPLNPRRAVVIFFAVKVIVGMTFRRSTILSLTFAFGLVFGCADDASDIVQKGCDKNSDCAGGLCIEGLPGGLCTANCSAQSDCPDGTACTDTEANGGVCLFTCSTTEQCVEAVGTGYVCDTETNLSNGEDVAVCIDE